MGHVGYTVSDIFGPPLTFVFCLRLVGAAPLLKSSILSTTLQLVEAHTGSLPDRRAQALQSSVSRRSNW